MSQEFINNYDQVNWIDIIDFRNLLVHEYFRIDLEIGWLIVQRRNTYFKISN